MPNITYEDIVTETSRPTLVLAGPGAGKTHLLGDRVKRLLDSGVQSRSITVLTFGVDAKQNMRNKLLDPTHGFGLKYDHLPDVSTMHALGFRIVNAKPRLVGLRKADLRVQSDPEIGKLLFRDAALSIGLPDATGTASRQCKSRGDCRETNDRAECAVCRAYWDIMSKCNRIDFDDQVLFACRILERDGDLLREYRNQCAHLLVDEYQDINAAQFRMIELLSRDSRQGLFVVGDDAQSIYGFRGASPEFILRFQKEDFPDAWTPPLAYSRRCHEAILGPAQATLEKLYPSWTGPQDIEYKVPVGPAPKVWGVPSEKSEAEWTARIAREAIGKHKTVLVLAPKAAFFPLLSRTLAKYGVPHSCPQNLLPEAVERRLEVAWSVLEWVNSPDDSFLARLAIEQVINSGVAKVPGARKGPRCSAVTIETRVAVETEIAQLWSRVSPETPLMAVLETLPSPSKELCVVREVLVGLRDSYHAAKSADKQDFAQRLVRATGAWTKPESLSKDLLALKREVMEEGPPGFASVQLITLRKAKGLEADVAVLVGLEDDILPGTIQDPEEQARLFYVGMTRGKDELHLIHSSRRPRDISFGEDLIDKVRSRFLDALGIKSRWPRAPFGTA